MKKELKNILKYLVVYGILLVTPAVLLAFVEVVADRMRGGTMNSDEVWNSPFMTSALLLGSLLIIAVPAEVKHWHGAAKDSWFQHLTYHKDAKEGASNEWLEPVTDDIYNLLK